MSQGIFVTGTDTGVGKSLVACALIHGFKAQGLRVAGMKPVASGSEMTSAGLRNLDALALQNAANVVADYQIVNPYCFAPAIAPQLAARAMAQEIQLKRLFESYQMLACQADVVVVEGAGGWRVPSEPAGYLSDFPEALKLDVVLVVGMRLGCLNHALLTAETIERGRQCRLIGWVANCIDAAFAPLEGNIATLREHLMMPCIGVIPHLQAPDAMTVANLLDIPSLNQQQ